ncbi:hypothetical protein [Haloechinothrix halophila]|uniref:hypothetical protein n=1 Tax=Haloechinothrix halophila TaxID=1069073 RepID=UPI000687D684|nr:hypothetical protein [Haloechinothrix halophila]
MVSVLTFAVAWWLGLYLLARDRTNPVLVLAGGGLLSYGAAIALDDLPWTGAVAEVLVWLPAVLWAVVLARLLRDNRAARERGESGNTVGLAVVCGLLVALAAGLVLLGTGLLPRELTLASIGLDLMLLGGCVAVFDAFDAGESLRGDMLRSAALSGLATALFGGQVAVVIAVVGPDPALTALLYGVVAGAIALHVLTSPLHSLADRAALAVPVRQARAELREVADALPRKANSALADIDEAEFARLTRRALSHYGDLGKLVSSPLTELPEIDKRLTERGAPDTPLERAKELKAVLLDAIRRLKPDGREFGTSEEWRYYNALYFYYVVGIRPYSMRTKVTELDATSRQALTWFADQVPERTLHNWQSAAARLVAADLRATSVRG